MLVKNYIKVMKFQGMPTEKAFHLCWGCAEYCYGNDYKILTVEEPDGVHILMVMYHPMLYQLVVLLKMVITCTLVVQ